MTDLPDFPDYFDKTSDGRMVHDPALQAGRREDEMSSSLKQKFVPFIKPVIALTLLGSVAFGAIKLGMFQGSPSPDERATAITKVVAQDAVLIVTGEDKDGSATARVKSAIADMEKESGCTFVAGTITTGNTAAAAAANADKLIASAKTTLAAQGTADEYGLGYTVVRGITRDTKTGRHVIPDQYVAVVAAIHCAPAQPAGPTGMGS